MPIKLGNKSIKDIYLGDKKIAKIYLGDKLVYQKGDIAYVIERYTYYPEEAFGQLGNMYVCMVNPTEEEILNELNNVISSGVEDEDYYKSQEHIIIKDNNNMYRGVYSKDSNYNAFRKIHPGTYDYNYYNDIIKHHQVLYFCNQDTTYTYCSIDKYSGTINVDLKKIEFYDSPQQA